MTTSTQLPPSAPPAPAPAPVPAFVLGGRFLEALAAQDFAVLASVLADDVELRALLPGGYQECAGPDEVAGCFRRWLGDTDDFEVVDVALFEIGGRVHLRWRLRLRQPRLGAGWFTIEQQAYADPDTSSPPRIARLDLLCSGYRAEPTRD
ncbi:MAG: nuclear transport factor 2 family protein [Nocardioidaceae bacterium]